VFAASAIAWPLGAPRVQEPLEHRAYVANDAGHRIDVFDVDRGHMLHHTITPRLNGRGGVPVVVGGQNGGVYRTPETSTR
jgi:hypothetical protein